MRVPSEDCYGLEKRRYVLYDYKLRKMQASDYGGPFFPQMEETALRKDTF